MSGLEWLLTITASVLAGTMIACLVIGLWPLILRRYERDIQALRKSLGHMSPTLEQCRRYIAAWYACLIGIPALSVLLLPGFVPAIGAGMFLLILPRLIVWIRLDMRKRLLEEQLPSAVQSAANATSAGMSLLESLTYVADHAEEPIAYEFRRIVHRYEHGEDLRSAIHSARDSIELEGFDLFAIALATNQELGGDVGKALRRIAASLNAIKQMRQRMRAATATGRTNIKVLAVAPLLILGLLSFLDAEAVTLLFTDTIGQVIIVACLAMTGFAVWWASTIVNQET